MVIRISFFLLPSCGPSHLLTSYLHFTLAFVCNQTAKSKEEAGAIDWQLHPRGGGGGYWGTQVNAGYVLLASQSPYPIMVYFVANYRPHLSHFLENVIFAIPTQSLSIYTSTLSMQFQVAECNAVNASLLLNLIKNNFLIFNRESSQKSENLRPHSSNTIENATPLKSL